MSEARAFPRVRIALVVCVALIALAARAALADTSLGPENVAIVVNEDDPASVQAGDWYREARRIPERNVIRVRIPGSPRSLDAAQFRRLARAIDRKLRPEIDVIALAWTAPYAVACNSITAALTLGFDASLCANTCAPAKASPYFDSAAKHPYAERRLRLSMLLPTTDLSVTKALIERGRSSAFQLREATAYFVVTSDGARNARAAFFPPTQRISGLLLDVKTIRADSVANRTDVIVYEIGAVGVPNLDTLRFLPGALADHMTSLGGDLLGDSQMSSLAWIDAGATASYGTVSEPCSHWQKFPHPTVLLKRYLAGDTAVEAHWKSVAWPAQGVFVGEPLAAPYCARCRTGEAAR